MNPSKRKGTAWEVRVRDYLCANGLDVYRPAQAGKNDKGDLIGVPHWTIECKSTKAITLASFMKEAEDEAKKGQTAYHAVVINRRMKHVSQAYAVIPLWAFVDLIGALGTVE